MNSMAWPRFQDLHVGRIKVPGIQTRCGRRSPHVSMLASVMLPPVYPTHSFRKRVEWTAVTVVRRVLRMSDF